MTKIYLGQKHFKMIHCIIIEEKLINVYIWTPQKNQKKELDFYEISDKSQDTSQGFPVSKIQDLENYCKFLIKSEEIISK